MKSGASLEQRIIKILKDEVIQNIRQPNPEHVPVQLLLDLIEMVKDIEAPEILGGMFDFAFPTWLTLITERIQECGPENQHPNHDHFDAVIKLLSISITDEEDDEGVERIDGNPKILPAIVTIFENSNWEHDRYIPILNVIAKCSNSNEDCADKFVEAKVHESLIGLIDEKLDVYFSDDPDKSPHGLFTDDSVETVLQQLQIHQTMAA